MPKNKLHIIYIPGLGDEKVLGQKSAVRTWRWYGVDTELYSMSWSDKRPWQTKFGELLAHIDKLANDGKQVGLVGASAGASAIINAYAARPDQIVGVVSIAGKINYPERIGQKYRSANPSFVESAYAAPESLLKLDKAKRRKILSIYSVMDGVVSQADSHVAGAKNRFTVIIGHPIVIAIQITLGAPGFIWFLKRQQPKN